MKAMTPAERFKIPGAETPILVAAAMAEAIRVAATPAVDIPPE
ncbi:MAG TPA: hypothetical protein VK770_11980 [Candidatus Acidoferrum sp.]|nr:hypothetical protein [Candidatus Acidoferrum sp.]